MTLAINRTPAHLVDGNGAKSPPRDEDFLSFPATVDRLEVSNIEFPFKAGLFEGATIIASLCLLEIAGTAFADLAADHASKTGANGKTVTGSSKTSRVPHVLVVQRSTNLAMTVRLRS